MYWSFFSLEDWNVVHLGKAIPLPVWVNWSGWVMVLKLYLVCRRYCWWLCSPPRLACVRRPPHGVAVGGLAFGFVCAQCLLSLLLFVAWPLCFLLCQWGATLSATAGSWESATSLFWGSTLSQHGWLPLGNLPLPEIRQFQSSNVGKQIMNWIPCGVSTECVFPAQPWWIPTGGQRE